MSAALNRGYYLWIAERGRKLRLRGTNHHNRPFTSEASAKRARSELLKVLGPDVKIEVRGVLDPPKRGV